MTAPSPLHLVPPADDALARALATPIPERWGKDTPSYQEAAQPAAIGAVLIGTIHPHLKTWEIAFVFRREMAEKVGKLHLAHASKAGAKLKHFAQCDFLVEVNWRAWTTLSNEQRVALIDHELCHFGMEVSEEGDEKPVLRPHDVEEFAAVVERHGLWKDDLKYFAKAVRQAELFE